VNIEYDHVKYRVVYSSTTAIDLDAAHVFTIIAAYFTSSTYVSPTKSHLCLRFHLILKYLLL
jgi:hypothetical protein